MTFADPELILMDEPSNHLDAAGRQLLYKFVQTTAKTLIIVSHDRALLRLVNSIWQLSDGAISVYGGNYDLFRQQYEIQQEALRDDIDAKEKALRKARVVERQAAERQQKLDARGKKKQGKAGTPRIMMNTLRNAAENSTAKMKEVHRARQETIGTALAGLRRELSAAGQIRLELDDSHLHQAKTLVTAEKINVAFHEKWLWSEPLTFRLTGGSRLAISGPNGSGKTTLLRLILGDRGPQKGELKRSDFSAVYLDQHYGQIDPELTVMEQALSVSGGALPEHEIRIRLNRFLFGTEDLDKPGKVLSGGERMRLSLCCLLIRQQPPELIVLDEPTNNLDLQNIEILGNAIAGYKGAVVVVSHDVQFLEDIGITEHLRLSDSGKGAAV